MKIVPKQTSSRQKLNLTNDQITIIVDKMFNGNLKEWEIDKSIEYVNDNSSIISIYDDEDTLIEEIDIAQYLNIHFYGFKHRVYDPINTVLNREYGNENLFEEWALQINNGLNKSYCQVNKIDDNAVTSTDIDSKTINVELKFMIQTNKVDVLDYYVGQLRNMCLGNTFELQNANGDELTAYITIGVLETNQDVIDTTIGECIILSCSLEIDYIQATYSYNDYEFYMSLDGDDTINENGEIVDVNGNPTETVYTRIAPTVYSYSAIFNLSTIPLQQRLANVGTMPTNATSTKTITFFDFKSPLQDKIDDIYWSVGAEKKNNIALSKNVVGAITNIVYLKVYNKVTENTYIYKYIIENITKDISNSAFLTTTMQLKAYAGTYQSANIPVPVER